MTQTDKPELAANTRRVGLRGAGGRGPRSHGERGKGLPQGGAKTLGGELGEGRA